nr:hypothetical protein [Tanacetum cinerariifolium]
MHQLIEEESDWSDEGKVNEKKIEWVSSDEDEDRQDDHDDDDDQSTDIEKTDDEDEYAEYEAHTDEYVHDDTDDEDEYAEYEAHTDEYVHDDVDEKMKDVENAETGKDDEEITDAEKVDAEKLEATKGDYEQVGKLPPTSSSLSVSFDSGNQFLNLSYDISLVGTTKDSVDTEINSLLVTPTPALPTKTHVSMALSHSSSVTTIPFVQQQTTPLPTPSITSEAPHVTIIIPDPLPAVMQRLDDLESKFKACTKVNHFEVIKASVQANVINEVKNQLPKVVKDLVESIMESTVQNVLQKDPINLEQHESQKDA